MENSKEKGNGTVSVSAAVGSPFRESLKDHLVGIGLEDFLIETVVFGQAAQRVVYLSDKPAQGGRKKDVVQLWQTVEGEAHSLLD